MRNDGGPVRAAPRFGGPAIVAGISLLTLGLHCATNGRYGYHGDELYFIACGEHLDLGYVDHAPLIAVWAKAGRTLLGDSLFAIRLAPALAGALAIWLTGSIARQFGGGRFAQALAALAVAVAPAYLRMGNMLCIPGLELLWWTLASYLVVLLLKCDRPRLWLWVGLVAGIGLLHKHSMLLWGVGLTAGLLLTPARRHLRQPWPWLGGLLAFCLLLPNLVWQAQNDWPTLTFLRLLNRVIMSGISPAQFLVGQVLYIHPVNLPIWLAGVGSFLCAKRMAPFRVFGWQYLVLLVLLLFINSKIYYLAPVYPVLLAGGAVMGEQWLAGRRARVCRPAVMATVVVAGAAFAPLGLPLLSLDGYATYVRALTFGRMANIWEISNDYLFMCGWEEQVETVAGVYRGLPEAERDSCAILAASYASASAIDFFGGRHGLPSAISPNLSYYLWGRRGATGEVLLTIGIPPERLHEHYGEVALAGRFQTRYCASYLKNAPICLCRRPKASLHEIWPQLRSW